MNRKITINLLIGCLIGISIALITLLFIDDTNEKTNSIRIFSALINSIILLLIASYFNRNHNNTKSLKDYFISDVTNFKTNYMLFLDRIDNEELTKREVLSRSKEFSMHSQQLAHTLNREFKIVTNIDKMIHKILTIHSGNNERIDKEKKDYFDTITDVNIVILSSQQNYLIAKERKDLNLILQNLVVNITKV